MSDRSKQHLLCAEWITLLGFVGVVAVCMVIYPDRSGHFGGYPFFHEFVSALGRTVTGEGVGNFGPALFFDITLGLAVLMLIPFWYLRSRCLTGKECWRWTAFVCCTYFSLGILGVGLTPYNLHPHLHNFCVYTAFIAIVPGGLLMLLKTGAPYYRYPQKWWGLGVIAVVLLSCFVVQFLMTRHLLPHRPTAPILQKLNIGLFLVWIAIEFKLYRRHLLGRPATAVTSSGTDEDADVADSDRRVSA